MALTKVTQHSLGNSAVTTAKLGTAPFGFANSSANVVFMAANGNVGVGTSTPIDKLTLSSGNLRHFVAANAANISALYDGDTSTNTYRIKVLKDGADGTAITFGTQISGGSYAERMRIHTDGRVGIGTSTPLAGLHLSQALAADTELRVENTQAGGYATTVRLLAYGAVGTSYNYIESYDPTNSRQHWAIGGRGNQNTLCISTNGNVEQMRITSGGGTRFACENFAAQPSSTNWGIELNNTGASSVFFGQGTGTETHINFGNRNGIRGSIQTTSGGTSFNTTSDYRLKENIAPMTGALTKVAQLNPVTYNWKIGGSGQGFIAHELQAIVPEAVTGEKDAVDENDEPKYQMVDTSFLVATLTAAIQELKAEFDAYKASHP